MPFQNIKDNNKISSSKKHKNENFNSKDTKLEGQKEKLNQNVSQSQETKMEIEEIFQDTNFKGSQSTTDSKNVSSSSELKENLKNVNCANSNIITSTKNNIFLFEEEINPPNKKSLYPEINITNIVKYQLSHIKKAIDEEKEKDIFKIDYSSKEESNLFLGEYINDIYSNLLSDEKNLKIKPEHGYMEKIQIDINPLMRGILIDWLIDIHFRSHQKDETLYQTIWIIDTYLSKTNISRSRFQLLGAAAFLISCKEYETFFPKLHEIADLTANAYTVNDLAQMENDILKKLEFSIIAPTAVDFYNIISKAFKFEDKHYLFGKYFLETYLLSYNSVKYPASVIGVSCAYVVMKFFGYFNYKDLYSKDFLREEYPQKSIKDVARDICFIVKEISNSRLGAVRNKYSTPQNLNVVQYCKDE